ncbi:MAG: tRNA (adenosine(37)-N6)-dimethylallyltransferase MiaA [Deltaproteobacteria bacterium]|nr:tRNA (adenosine(37)-N6)-dimethylallyltransferase MiaA [Deltaproteobacteria bacterium]
MESFQSKPTAIIICGPTGIGKTSFAIELAKLFQGEIIGADSMQIYRHMDIGTAKPTSAERSVVRHYMVDIVDPDEPFDAETYAALSLSIVMALQTKQILPFVVGGTGLYIKSLIYGLFDAQPTDKEIRIRLKQEAEKEGPAVLFERLKQVDPVTARKVHVNDIYRIVRALEVYETSGTPISDYQQQHRFQESSVTTLKFGLHMELDHLYDRIDRRVDMMIRAGLLEEVRRLRESGYSRELKPMQSIGYRHMLDFLDGCLDWPETIRTLKRDTRRYAKRQMTWFKADREVVWVDPVVSKDVENRVRNFLTDPSSIKI